MGERIATEVSGHKTRSIFQRHNITTSDELRHAVAAVQDFLSNQPAESRVTSLRTSSRPATEAK